MSRSIIAASVCVLKPRMSSRFYSSERANHITVHPSNITLPTYTVTRIKAEMMVARGQAKWIVGTRRLREVNGKVRGVGVEWRPRQSGGFTVLQLTEPKAKTSWRARLAR
jgi:hypothetical protein